MRMSSNLHLMIDHNQQTPPAVYVRQAPREPGIYYLTVDGSPCELTISGPPEQIRDLLDLMHSRLDAAVRTANSNQASQPSGAPAAVPALAD
jgi:hypothetical protein